MSSAFKNMVSSLSSKNKDSALTIKQQNNVCNIGSAIAMEKAQPELSNDINKVPETNLEAKSQYLLAKSKEKDNLAKKSKKKLTAFIGKLQSSVNNHKPDISGKTKVSNDNVKSTESNNNKSVAKHVNEKNDENEDDEIYSDVLDCDELVCQLNNQTVDDIDEQTKADYLEAQQHYDMPTFLHTENCDSHLIEETRKLLRERYAKNPEFFYEHDYKRMLSDDWTVSRFLLRRRLDPKRTAKLMEECGRFRKQYQMSEIQLYEFPIEFHKAGGLFQYARDRVGNITCYMRVKMYRRVPEISDVFKAFILCVLERCDIANNGRGVVPVFDLSGCGLQNVDLSFLSWLLSSFRNYCPKGVSYILVYNLPWILNATCKLAMTWMSASNKRALRFAYGDEILSFIARENLPDYCGGTCNMSYKVVPEGSKPAIEVCDRLDLTRDQAIKIKELFLEYLENEGDEDNQTKDDNKSADQPSELVSQAS